MGSNNKMKSGMDLYHVKLTFILSLLAWPITYYYNNVITRINENMRPFWMMTLGFIFLSIIGVVAHKLSKIKDWLYTGIVIFAFSAVIDLIISLEHHGIIYNFMTEYLKYGEPYLFCTWGTALTFFDAIGFYTMHHLIVYFFTNGKSWRSVGIYFGSGILHSMIVLLLGALVGQTHTPTFCILLNIPFVVFPTFILIRAFGKEKRCNWTTKSSNKFLIFDLMLALGLIVNIWVTLAKGLLAFGCQGWPVEVTVGVEGTMIFLEDPAPFARLQAIEFLFYLVPIQCVTLIYLFKKDKPQFLWELTVVHAGAVMQAQFTIFFQCLSPTTSPQLRDDWNIPQLWIINLLLVIIPHFIILRLWYQRNPGNDGIKLKTK